MNALLSDTLLQPTPRTYFQPRKTRGLWRCPDCGAWKWHSGIQTAPKHVTFDYARVANDPVRCARCRKQNCWLVTHVNIPSECEEPKPRRKGAIRAGWRIDL